MVIVYCYTIYDQCVSHYLVWVIIVWCGYTVMYFLTYSSPEYSWGNNNPCLLLLSHHVLDLLLTANPPYANNKSVKALYGIIQYLEWSLMSSTVLGFALFCNCHSTPPLIYNICYITHNSALKYTCNPMSFSITSYCT